MPSLPRLLADLALAGVEAHTRAGVARRVASALGRACALEQFELGWCDANGSTAAAVVAVPADGGWRVSERTRVLRGTAVRAALRTGRPAQDDGVVFPFGERGYAALRLEGELPTDWADGLESLGDVLRVAHAHCAAIDRVAQVSRRAHVQSAALRARLAQVQVDPVEVVAESPAMKAALARLDAVADHDTSVLLLGPSGTGKSLLARRLHERSRRRAGPLVTVNCGALPAPLIESELFGHVPGAFTGAGDRPRRGRFARADGGTLFLDEVAELPLAAQAKLLRALQDGVIEPLGSEREQAVDVRIVAATHQPLEARVRDGSFRADLFYRLAVFPVLLPSLAERPDDLPLLVDRIVRDLAARRGEEPLQVSARALQRLAQQPWPGNVRELRNVLERASILSRGKRLELGAALAGPSFPHAPTAPGVQTFEAAARAAIEAALRAANGKLYGADGAGALLGLNPSTLQTKMRKYGIQRAPFVR